MRQTQSQDDPNVYAVRITAQAHYALQETRQWQADNIGPAQAAQWYDGFLAAVGSLATLPLRCPVADENEAFQQFHPGPSLRVLLFRQGRRTVWRLLFNAHGPTADDPAFVQVHLIRHGAEASLTEWPAEED